MTRPDQQVPGGRLSGVRAVVRDPAPLEFEALLERRRRLGLDVLDEVWDGVPVIRQVPAAWHAQIAQQLAEILGPLARQAGLVAMISSFNLGAAEDYRVPDGGLFHHAPDQLYTPSVELVVEIQSAGDGTWDKLGFYAAHDARELLIIDPPGHTVHWLALQPDSAYRPIQHSTLLALGAAELAERIAWPH